MAITKKDIELLKEVFATKADLEGFAKKADLEGFAKKADLEGFAKKADLEEFAKKADLEGFAKKADLEGFATKKELKALESKVDAGFDRILTGQDKIIQELEKAREDRIFAFAKDKEQDSRLDNLDGRVKRLETARA